MASALPGIDELLAEIVRGEYTARPNPPFSRFPAGARSVPNDNLSDLFAINVPAF
jgi:hypothetical protein